MTDREKAGLRGQVKTCIEEIVHSIGTSSVASEYSLDGKLVTRRHTNPDDSEWLTTYEYDADGRLTKFASGKVGDPSSTTLYTYDEGGKLTEITGADGRVVHTSKHNDKQGRKIATKTFSSEVLEQYRGSVAVDSRSIWAATEMGMGVPTGGSVTIVYDNRDLPVEMQVLDNGGRIVTRFVRTYDANGRVLEEHQILENPALGMAEKFSAEQGIELDGKQLEAMNKAMKMMMGGRDGTGKSYKYDSERRVIEVRDRNFMVETVTTTSYNEHGDKSEERITTRENHVFPVGVPHSMDETGTLVPVEPIPAETPLPKQVFEPNIVEYRYEYDQHGNWTQETTTHRSESHEYSAVRRHVLKYY
jgi:YD repeat-containing protein